MPDNLFGLTGTTLWIVIGGAIFIGLLIFFAWIKTLLQICPPNEVLIFSGRKHRMADGTRRGFRVIFGGRAWRWPIIERASRMSLNVMEVPIAIRGAYSQGGIPLNVDAIANVKVSSDPSVVGNAIERFLGRDPNEIRRVAKETLEGHLRGVLARLTPEEVNEDRLKFAEELTRESELDLSKLGIHLDTFKVQHVSDEVHYLDSIGREAIANVVKDAEIAESDAKRAAEQAEAENMARGNVSKANAEANIAKMRNELRKIQADLEAQVTSEEEKTKAAAREARAIAEQELQGIRAELEKLRLNVEQVLPAEAERVANELRAKGDSAILRERGIAASKSLDLMTQAWSEAGSEALGIYLMEDIEKVLATASKGVSKIQVGSVSVIDSGDGRTLPNYIAAYPSMLQAVFESVEKTTGLDIQGAVSGVARTVNEEPKS
jgi:flotillin